MGSLSISHAAWDAHAVHGVHPMYSVSKLGTACGQPHPSSIFRAADVFRIADGPQSQPRSCTRPADLWRTFPITAVKTYVGDGCRKSRGMRRMSR
jgi:hypothetical protein